VRCQIASRQRRAVRKTGSTRRRLSSLGAQLRRRIEPLRTQTNRTRKTSAAHLGHTTRRFAFQKAESSPMQTQGSLMETENVPANPTNVAEIGRESARNSILRAVAVFAIRCALASLSLWTRPQRRSPAKEIHRTKAVNGARMALATLDQQLYCDCSSCSCEILVTAFR
jgi:hypothetical protein